MSANKPGVTVLLIGRPNSGKSSLFNALTGGDAKVGNFPGVTVDVLESALMLPGGVEARLVDLPGVYALAGSTDAHTDEGQAIAFLERAATSGQRVVIAQVVDATQLALGLRLTRQIAARRLPTLIILTQRDALHARGFTLSPEAVEAGVGFAAVGVSAGQPGVRDVITTALAALIARGDQATAGVDFDERAVAAAAVTEAVAPGPRARTQRALTDRVDRFLLHPVLGPAAFIAIMTALFAAVFLIADPASTAIDLAIGKLGDLVTRVLGEGLVASLLKDGVLGGAGTVLAFLPQIVTLTVALELIDASGYLARGAFLIDRALQAVGLGGRSFIPLLTAHACAVPAIAATRIIRDPRQRLRTMLVLPLMTCSARIPTYSLLIGTFFAGRSAMFRGGTFVLLYFAGIALGGLASLVIGRASPKRNARSLPLVLEMPPYRRPRARVMARVAWRGTTRFVREVGTGILIASVVLWALLTVPAPGRHAAAAADAPARVVAMHDSVAAWVGREIEPVTRPMGFDWRINVGLIGSFGARELMVSTLGIIFGIEDAAEDNDSLKQRIREAKASDGSAAYSGLTAAALMAFFVIACQCTSTVAALKRETRGWKWPLFVLGYTYGLAYLAAVLVYQGGRALGWG